MSTKAYKEKSRQWIEGDKRPCLGLCGIDLDAAYSRVSREHPEWPKVRREARAWIEMVKRGSMQ